MIPTPSALKISDIPSATVEPVVMVRESDDLSRARTLMEMYDFSQLPVIRGKGRRPSGVVSWKSIGRRLSLDPNTSLGSCVDKSFPKAKLDDELIPVIPRINEQGYVVVLKVNGDISGIVTSSDIGDALIDVASPFMLIEECELLLRNIVGSLLDTNQVKRETLEKHLLDPKRQSFDSLDDLTLGDVTAIFCSREVRENLSSHYDLLELGKTMAMVVNLRNTLMHFRIRTSEHDRVESILPRVNRMLREILTSSLQLVHPSTT